MSHHDHHHHEEHHETESAITFDKKMVKLLEHWIKHNSDHVETYREWAKKAKENDMEKVFVLLNEAAERSSGMNTIFKEALSLISK
ncbi:MAG: hypothetical protein R6V76_04440 [Desulfobacterales bacterium]